MNKREALDIAITAMFREILREDGEYVKVPPGPPYGPPEPHQPTPQYDFVDDDFCEHNGHLVPKATCPVHGPESETVPTAEELDGLTGDDSFEEENPMIARARRLAAQKQRQESQQREWPEELPMSGAGPPPDIPPNLVV